MVLLKNEQALPLEKSAEIALFGVNSFEFIAGGTGSGDVNEAYNISLYEGLRNAGFGINSRTFEAFEKHKENNPDGFEKPEGLDALMYPFMPPQLIPSQELADQAGRESDIAIITIGRNGGEGADRVEKDDFLLTAQEQSMIRAVTDAFHKVDKKVIVVLNIGGVVETASWKGLPDGILLAWQGGQEGGNAVADLLSGKATPSGKLPMTFPVHLADHASSSNFPMDGTPVDFTEMILGIEEKPENEWVANADVTVYEEGIYVGYRHFDKENIKVSYPFGYGLSYTSFDFTALEVLREKDTIQVSVTVRNTGESAGKEVVQLYSSKPETSIDRPKRELRSFAKTPLLLPGDSTSVKLQIPVSELSYWNEAQAGWELEEGSYLLEVGASSRDLRLGKVLEMDL
jgi:beta-glucosidase